MMNDLQSASLGLNDFPVAAVNFSQLSALSKRSWTVLCRYLTLKLARSESSFNRARLALSELGLFIRA
jgi:hypothetical protein